MHAQREGQRVFHTLGRDGDPFIAGLIAAIREIPAPVLQPEIQRCRQRLEMRQDNCCVVGPGRSQQRDA